MTDELGALKTRIDLLAVLYLVLFGASLVVLVARWVTPMPTYTHFVWAVLLGGAVVCRLVRTSMVNKYNALLAGGGPAAMT